VSAVRGGEELGTHIGNQIACRCMCKLQANLLNDGKEWGVFMCVLNSRVNACAGFLGK